MLQEQIAVLTSHLEAERAATARTAREGALRESSGLVEKEKDAWRAREMALRAEYDRELAAARARCHADIDEERARGVAAARAEAARHIEDVSRLQVRKTQHTLQCPLHLSRRCRLNGRVDWMS